MLNNYDFLGGLKYFKFKCSWPDTGGQDLAGKSTLSGSIAQISWRQLVLGPNHDRNINFSLMINIYMWEVVQWPGGGQKSSCHLIKWLYSLKWVLLVPACSCCSLQVTWPPESSSTDLHRSGDERLRPLLAPGGGDAGKLHLGLQLLSAELQRVGAADAGQDRHVQTGGMRAAAHRCGGTSGTEKSKETRFWFQLSFSLLTLTLRHARLGSIMFWKTQLAALFSGVFTDSSTYLQPCCFLYISLLLFLKIFSIFLHLH